MLVTSAQPTPRALTVAATLILSTTRRRRIQPVTRRVSFAPSSAHGREVSKIFLPQAGSVQVKREPRTSRQVGKPTTGRSTSRRRMRNHFTPGIAQPGQASTTSTGQALMTVRVPASAASVIVGPSSAVRREKCRRRGCR
nr:hypothetical protein [Corynebacterium provencense]